MGPKLHDSDTPCVEKFIGKKFQIFNGLTGALKKGQKSPDRLIINSEEETILEKWWYFQGNRSYVAVSSKTDM